MKGVWGYKSPTSLLKTLTLGHPRYHVKITPQLLGQDALPWNLKKKLFAEQFSSFCSGGNGPGTIKLINLKWWMC